MSSQSKAILITAGRVYDHFDTSDRPARADILILGNHIEAVEPNLAEKLGGAAGPQVFGAPVETVIDASDRLVLPGLVNAHYHSHDTLLKGCFETIPRETWLLNALPPNYSRRSPAEIRARTLLGAVECLRAGITTVQDMLTLAPLDPQDIEVVLQAYEDAGIRCVLGLQTGDVHGAKVTPFWDEIFPEAVANGLSGVVVNDSGALALAEELRRIHERFSGRKETISWGLAPSSPERCSPAFLRALAQLATDMNLPVFTHIYESRATTLIARQKFAQWGGSLVSYLAAHDMLGTRTSLAHGVWMLPHEIDMVAEAGASVVLNPVGNLKTRSGVAPAAQYLAAGINLGLGCDNNSCSDAQNLFQAMKALAGLAAVSNVEAERPTARDALLAATAGGARALGLANAVGAIRPGLKADLTLLRLDDPSFMPFNNAARQVVFSECGRAVDTVLVNGRILVRDGRCISVNESQLRDQVEDAMAALREEIASVSARTETLRPQLSEAHRRTWDAPLEVHRYVGNDTPAFTVAAGKIN
ncbi:amidohydrolase family protein [Ferrovibrio sp.]|uniref:amidohydrolase family protein n=1 Tax=Ferrovibrio sp. TaxID=1917215 RepID=UPI0035B01315